MNLVTTFSRWLFGNSLAQRDGKQSTTPAHSVYDEVPAYTVDGALQISTVWACIKLRIETIASLPVGVFRKIGDDRREAATNSIIYSILRHMPNAYQTPQEFWEYMMLNLLLRGNAFAWIKRTARGQAVALLPLSSDQIEVDAARDGSTLYYYTYENVVYIYTSADILHIKSMGNGRVGLSTLDHMRASINVAINAQNHTSRLYRKEGRRPGVLMSDHVLTKQQRDRIKENFSELKNGGPNELYVLEASFKFEPLGMTPADLQLLESRRYSVEDLARWFGVPSVLVNDTQKTTTWGTGVSEIIEGFYKFTVRPDLNRIEQSLERWLLSPEERAEGIYIRFNFDALFRASLKDRVEIYAKQVQNGLKTRNECRIREDDEPLPGADILTAQSNLAPLSMLGRTAGATGGDSDESMQGNTLS